MTQTESSSYTSITRLAGIRSFCVYNFFLENMSSLFLCSVFIVTITFTLAAQNFVEVADCPKTADEWDMRSKKKNCLVDSLVYLCAAIENKLGRYGEICTYQRWIPESKYTCTRVE